MTVIVCAATRTELDACAKGLSDARAVLPPFEPLLTGVGPEQARLALERRLTLGERPTLVVSSGFAGALTSDLDVGTWITAARLRELRDGRVDDVDGIELRTGPPPAVLCEVVSSGHVITAEHGPSNLREGRNVAVDMESAALARIAARARIPLMVLRLVSDTPARPLPGFLGAFAASMAATSGKTKAYHALRGAVGALVDPRGVARIARDSTAWARELERGWRHFAELRIDRMQLRAP